MFVNIAADLSYTICIHGRIVNAVYAYNNKLVMDTVTHSQTIRIFVCVCVCARLFWDTDRV